MAKKRKTSKKQEKKEFSYSAELIGIFLIVIGILGLGFGPVGNIIKKFAMFLVGEFWWSILILVFFMGFYMIVKRKLPSFFSTKLLGLYIFKSEHGLYIHVNIDELSPTNTHLFLYLISTVSITSPSATKSNL